MISVWGVEHGVVITKASEKNETSEHDHDRDDKKKKRRRVYPKAQLAPPAFRDRGTNG